MPSLIQSFYILYEVMNDYREEGGKKRMEEMGIFYYCFKFEAYGYLKVGWFWLYAALSIKRNCRDFYDCDAFCSAYLKQPVSNYNLARPCRRRTKQKKIGITLLAIVVFSVAAFQ